MFKSALLLLLAAASASAFAADLNLGYQGDGREIPLVSIRTIQDKKIIRISGERVRAQCSPWRKDLCGLEDQVAQVEVVIPASDCTFASNTLGICRLNDFQIYALVTLKDGSFKTVEQISGSLSIGQKTVMVYKDKSYVPKTFTTIGLEIWGHRADGLDPVLSIREYSSLYSTNLDIIETKASLFK